MKKVRFQSTTMDESDCHSPRPFIMPELDSITAEKHMRFTARPSLDMDAVTLYETSNGIPYPVLNKSEVHKPNWAYKENVNIQPTDQLNLSFLDSSYIEPRKPILSKTAAFQPLVLTKSASLDSNYRVPEPILQRPALNAIENRKPINQPIAKDNSFFIRRENMDINSPLHAANFTKNFMKLNITKQNDVISKKTELMHNIPSPTFPSSINYGFKNQVDTKTDFCKCHDCRPTPQPHPVILNQAVQHQPKPNTVTHCYHEALFQNENPYSHPAGCRQRNCHSNCERHIPVPVIPLCQCNKTVTVTQNTLENKTRAIEKLEQSRQTESTEIEKATTISKEKREPTVADLFNIIKLQNEQLQLLQQKVDRFISTEQSKIQPMPTVQNYLSEKVTVETVENDHKISVGVMTSFEIRTSTIINKEVVRAQNVEVSKRQEISKDNSNQPMINFLDGIPPVNSPQTKEVDVSNSFYESDSSSDNTPNKGEKTLNELSLYNVQVDNATTPMLSPEQTMYLDVRDYSNSDSGSDEQSNVGWTYYNTVMAHVNGLLQESDIPSSASALQRDARRHLSDRRLEMHIDKTNVSILKRVKFGDEPNVLDHLTQGATDTSMKMNQLAAKYLKHGPQYRRAQTLSTELSFATRKYMEKHQLLQGTTAQAPPARPPVDTPRFLDITALKQQPKFL